jgi:outer membrane lipoprotein-sorting protein
MELEDRTLLSGSPLTYVVTNTNDSGAGSLRNAIQLANAHPGTDTIAFNIAGSGVHIINVLSALPSITDPTIIDGTTQPGYAGTPLIELNGASAGTGVNGLTLDTGSSGSTIRGLAIDQFSVRGIFITDGSGDDLIAGDFLGVDPTGLLAAGNGTWGIDVNGAGAGNVIGGTTAADRNVISANSMGGIALNGAGVTNTLIEGNDIGVGADGTTPLGNADYGGILVLGGSAGNTIGGTAAGAGNIIADNTTGIDIWGNTAAIEGNSIYGNTALGIDLGGSGVVVPNAPGVRTGPNNLQNYPVLAHAATDGAGNLWVDGTFNSVADQTYRLEFFASPTADPTGYGQGQTYLGYVNVTTDGSGNASFGTTLAALVPANSQISATATALSTNVTSEFAQDITAVSGGLTVTNTNDTINGNTTSVLSLIANPGPDGISLREAITAADNTPGANTITFDIPGGGIQTIALASLLPAITEPVTLDATSQPGYAGTPLIEVDGAAISGGTSVLDVDANGVTIVGLALHGASNGNAIQVDSVSGTIVQGDYLGLSATGISTYDTGTGIVLTGSTNSLIGGTTAAQRDVISGNWAGVRLESGASGNVIEGDYIGTNVAGTAALANTTYGILVTAASNNTIGGTASGAGNVISGNGAAGIEINGTASTGNLVEGNDIGTDAAGTRVLANGGYGIEFADSFANTIGGTAAGAGNVISGNILGGVGITGDSSLLVSQNNSILRIDAQTGAIEATYATSVPADNAIFGPDGSLYVADYPNQQILHYGANGNLLAAFGAGHLGDPQGMVFGPDGNLYVADTNSSVQKFSPTGTFLGTFVAPGSGGLSNAKDLVFGPGGNLYVASWQTSSVLCYNGTTGAFLNTFVTGGSGGLSGPEGLAFGPDGNLYVSSDGTNSVLRYSGADGALLGTFTSGGTLSGPWGIRFDQAGNLDVASAGNGQIETFSGTSGAFLGNLATGLANPESLAASPGNTIQGNFIGTDTSGTLALPNAYGIVVTGLTSPTTIGGSGAGEANTIAYNSGAGVAIEAGSGNAILANSIYANGGLGIELGAGGVTANHPGFLADSPNFLQNFPVLTAAVTDGTQLAVIGTLNSLPDKTYRLEFFSNTSGDPSGYGQGQNYLGYATVTTDSAGNAAFTVTLSSAVPLGAAVTATATDSTGGTSEFGANIAASTGVPVNTVPPAQTTNENTPLVFSGGSGNPISISDLAVGNNPIQVALSVSNGTLALNGTAGLTITAGANGTASVTVQGTVTALDAALDGLQYSPVQYYSGSDTLSLTTNDLGNTGVGGIKTAGSTVSIAVTHVNQAPTGASHTVTTLENTAYTFAVADFGFSDPHDSPPNNLAAVEITTLPGAGTLSDGGTAVTAGQFVAVADISGGNLLFTPAADAHGTGYASFTFQVQDNGGTANGGANLDPVPKTMTVNVTYVNQPPVVATPASATPSPVTGTTTNLSVLGADVGGEANLTYTWATTGTPPAPVTFSANDSNAAKNTTATFTQAGNYSFQVTITDAGGLSTTSTVNVTVNPTLASIAVTPTSAALVENQVQQFAAVGYDQFGQVLANQPAVSWSQTAGIGSIDSAGLYTAPAAAGSATIAARGGGVSGSASVTVNNAAPVVATPASATPSPVTGTTTNLSVLGADDGGEANLTYTWATTGTPPAPVTFSANNSNAARNTTATFTQAGNYSFQVTITDAGGLSTTSTVNVTVNPTLASIAVTPAAAALVEHQVQQFSAVGYDQFGQVLANQPAVSWSQTAGIGSIDATGLYTAPAAAGSATIAARSGGVSGVASVTVSQPNTPPVIAAPGAQNAPPQGLVFSAAGGNAIVVSDPAVGGQAVQVTLVANQGAIRLGSTAGITFFGGTSAASPTMVFQGSLANINTALNGLTFTPNADAAQLQIIVDDLGHTGTGVAQTAVATVAITQIPLLPPSTDPTITPVTQADPTVTLVTLADPTINPAGPASPAISPALRKAVLSPSAAATGYLHVSTSLDLAAQHSGPANTPDASPQQGVKSRLNISLPAITDMEATKSMPAETVKPRAGSHGVARREIQADLDLSWLPMDAIRRAIDQSSDGQWWSIGAAVGVTTVISVGYVMWCLRAGYLMTSAVSALPLWRAIDPLPILDQAEKARRTKGGKREPTAAGDDEESRVELLMQ